MLKKMCADLPSAIFTVILSISASNACCVQAWPKTEFSALGDTIIIIDTDMAIDDWPAILYLLNKPRISVAAITVTGTGEAHCAQGITNALKLVETFRSVKEYSSCLWPRSPLDGYHVFPALWRQGANSLYGETLPDPSIHPNNVTAVDVLEQCQNKVRLL